MDAHVSLEALEKFKHTLTQFSKNMSIEAQKMKLHLKKTYEQLQQKHFELKRQLQMCQDPVSHERTKQQLAEFERLFAGFCQASQECIKGFQQQELMAANRQKSVATIDRKVGVLKEYLGSGSGGIRKDTGNTGAYNRSYRDASGRGLGKLDGMEINISQKGLNIVKNHLLQFGDYPENSAMIKRLEDALYYKKKISGADASFYMHEISEAIMMKKGIDYDTAHAKALQKYNVSPFSVYHPDVIKSMPENFGMAWKKFWRLD